MRRTIRDCRRTEFILFLGNAWILQTMAKSKTDTLNEILELARAVLKEGTPDGFYAFAYSYPVSQYVGIAITMLSNDNAMGYTWHFGEVSRGLRREDFTEAVSYIAYRLMNYTKKGNTGIGPKDDTNST